MRREFDGLVSYSCWSAVRAHVWAPDPGPSKTTRVYLHTEEPVVAALERAGFTIARTEMTGTSFFFSHLLEATRVGWSALGGNPTATRQMHHRESVYAVCTQIFSFFLFNHADRIAVAPR